MENMHSTHRQKERPSYTDPDIARGREERERIRQGETLESVYLHNLFFEKSLGEE